MSASGGPRRRVRGMVLCLMLGGVALLAAGLPPSPMLIATGAFLFLFSVPVASGCMQTILQTKVDSAVQGRIFAFTGMVVSAMMPAAYLASGPAADRLFEPWLAPGGALAGSLGFWIGVGPGRGVAAAFVAAGLSLLLVTAATYANPRVRSLEDELPDAVQDSPPSVPFYEWEAVHEQAK